MEKRAMIALALSFVVFLVFMYIGEKSKVRPLPEAQQAQQAQQPQPVQPAQPPPAPAPAKPAVSPTAPKPAAAPARPAKDVVVETPLFRAVFTEAGGRLKSFQLKKYLESLPFTPISHFKLGPVGFELERYHSPQNSTAQPKELVRPGPGQDFPLGLSWEGKGLAVPGTLPCEASRPGLNLRDGDKETLKFTCVSPEGLTFVKTFTFKGDSYGFDLAVQVANHTGQNLDGQLDLDLSENFTGEDASRFHFLGFNGSINNKWEEIKSGGLKEPKTFTGKIDWAGLDEGYFLTAMVPQAAPKALVRLQETPPGPMVASLRTPVESLPAGQAAQFSYALYFGPKDLKDLKPLGLERAVNFGWFDFLGRPSALRLEVL